VYPPAAAFAIAPFAILPFWAANVAFLAFGLGCAAFALRLLDVRDWRCYGAAFLSVPVFSAAANGTVSLLLLLGAAAAWRYRRTVVRLGAVVAALVALKLFLWPLTVWFVATRRWRAVAASAAIGAAVMLVPWAAIRFAGLRDYPTLLHTADSVFASHSNSLFAAGLGLGLGERSAHLTAWTIGLVLLAISVIVARRTDGDRRSFAAALGAALALTPIVWAHYLALVLVPLAVMRPRFSRLWLVLPATWPIFLFVPFPVGSNAGRPADVPEKIWRPLHASSPSLWQTLAYTAIAAVVVFVGVRTRREDECPA
jgi:alpha-1,2-mannosyltransferase